MRDVVEFDEWNEMELLNVRHKSNYEDNKSADIEDDT